MARDEFSSSTFGFPRSLLRCRARCRACRCRACRCRVCRCRAARSGKRRRGQEGTWGLPLMILQSDICFRFLVWGLEGICFTQNETLKPPLVAQLLSREAGRHRSCHRCSHRGRWLGVFSVWTSPVRGRPSPARGWPEEGGATRGWGGGEERFICVVNDI